MTRRLKLATRRRQPSRRLAQIRDVGVWSYRAGMTSWLLPRIFTTVPGVEDLWTVIDYLQAAGAQITTARREFVIEGR